MWKADLKNHFAVLIFSLMLATLAGCGSSEKCVGAKNEFVTGPKGPRKIYIPEYYVYKRGKYEFVKGHYRWVLSRKTYLKRGNRGYVSGRQESASTR